MLAPASMSKHLSIIANADLVSVCKEARLLEAFRETIVRLIEGAVEERLGGLECTDRAQKGQAPEVWAPGPEVPVIKVGSGLIFS